MSKSDTPRTDAETGTGPNRYVHVYADFARTLERELAAANAWKEAVINSAVVGWTYSAADEDDPIGCLSKLLAASAQIALDPAVSSDAAALIERGRREVRAEVETLQEIWRINSDAFAAKEAEVEVLRVAAQVVLDAMEAVRIANRSEGAGGGSWVSKPATREHQARVMKAYADMRKAEADLRAALAKEQP
jgi:hypothetical protein